VTTSRDTALDGLRGIAALVVLTSHLLVASVPTLANATRSPGSEHASGVDWALIYTPLHAFWGGTEAVIVFFVLSGFVLALPVARGRPFRAISYYPHRLLRLYVPVWGALCLAVVAHLLIRGSEPGGTWWLTRHLEDFTTHGVSQSFLLLGDAGTYSLLAVLWSLHWEVLFSLLLPLFLIVGRATRGVPLASAAAVVALIFVSDQNEWLRYMPAFLLGTAMAFQQHRIEPLRARFGRGRGPVVEGALLVTSAVGLSADWWIRIGGHALTGHDAKLGTRLGVVLVTLGAGAAVALAILGPRTRAALEALPIAWAGSRSYSLYLVHEPVVVVVAFALGGAPALPLLVVVAVPLALLVTEAFYRAVERPSHRLARRIGSWGGTPADAPNQMG
jgi:peptidoglycan/LPS O-acetylase OafA/YrhL